MDRIVSILHSSSTVLISSHVAPDPDAIGSSIALGLALEKLGKKVSWYYEDNVPQRMTRLVAPLLQTNRITNQIPNSEFDLVIVTDTATKDRAGKAHKELLERGKITLNIDHHISNTLWAQENYLDTDAPASALIIEELITKLGSPFSAEISNLLWAGLIDDTGSFRFNNTTARALLCAGRLVANGADPSYVARELYYTVPIRVLHLRAKALAGLRMVAGGKVALTVVDTPMLESLGASAEDSEGLVDELRLIEGTAAAVLVRQIENGWKLSLRAKDSNLDVGAIAARFGGGGHKAAAGCRISGSAEEVVAQIENCFLEVFR